MFQNRLSWDEACEAPEDESRATGTILGMGGVCADDPVERAALVAVAVEAADEVTPVLVAERDGDILGSHFSRPRFK